MVDEVKEDVYAKILRDAYRCRLPWPDRRDGTDWVEQRKAYRDQEQALNDELAADLAKYHGVTDNPKNGMLFAKAWEHGHSGGASEVANNYADFVELIK